MLLYIDLYLSVVQEDDLLILHDFFNKYSVEYNSILVIISKTHILITTIINKISNCPAILLNKLLNPYSMKYK